MATAKYQYNFKSHLQEPGGPEFTVFSMFQDRNGLVFLGTDVGLYKYDGRKAEQIPFADSVAIAEVTAIAQRADGTLWAGTEAGALFRLHNGQLHSAPDFPQVVEAGISTILFDDEDNIWVGTKGSGIVCSRAGNWQTFSAAGTLSDDYINDICYKNDQIWIATDRGITVAMLNADTISFKVLNTRDGLPDNIILSLTGSKSSDYMWIGTHSRGFCAYDVLADTFYVPKAQEHWNYGPINDLLEYDRGVLWMGTNDRGLIEWKQGSDPTLHHLRHEKNLAGNRVFDLMLDQECNAWVATNDLGLLTVNRQIALVEVGNGGNELGNVLALHADKTGYVWYSTSEGLFGFDPANYDHSKFDQYEMEERGDNDLIISIYASAPGELWLGTFGNGLYYFNTNTGRQFHLTKNNGLINDNVLSISGSNDTIWLATLGGVSMSTVKRPLNSGRDVSFMDYDQQNGLGTNYIYQVYLDRNGDKWFATDGEGITRLQGGQFTTFNMDNGLKSETIYSITDDHLGNIWFSTHNEGIYKYDGDTFHNYGINEGLRDLHISSLATDKYGRIVIVNEEGLDILDPSNDHLFYIGGESGIGDLENNLNDFAIDRGNNIWIGSQRGIVRYSALPKSCRSQPATLIKDVKIFLDPVDEKGPLEVSYNKNHFSFDYTGLWYQNPGNVKYQYKLDGYDLDWNTTRDESVIYPSLDPGTYTFMVRSSIDNNFRNASLLTYHFAIQPPFYLRPWFIICTVVLLVLSVYWYVRARENRLKAIERLKKEKVDFQFQTLRSQVNPHFLFNSFNTLLNIIDIDQKSASEYVQRLSDFFRNLLTHREQEVILLSEELKMLEDYYFLQQKRYGKNFILTVDIEHPERYFIPPMTLQLLVENALKHNIVANSKPMTVEVKQEEDELIVMNNLQRKREPERSTRVGLSNVVKRYKILFDKEVKVIEFEDQFIVKLPLIKL